MSIKNETKLSKVEHQFEKVTLKIFPNYEEY